MADLMDLRRLVRKSLAAYSITEGGSSIEEMEYLAGAAKYVSHIGEIGFNTGLSSHTFLNANDKAEVVSFDIGTHTYINKAKSLVDELYPNRHTLILGNSTLTVPEFKQYHPEFTFDLVFIDGGHSYKVASADLRNMAALSRSDTLVIFDDVTPFKSYRNGPYQAWGEAIQDGLVEQIEFVQDGKVVDKPTEDGVHMWVVGRYLK